MKTDYKAFTDIVRSRVSAVDVARDYGLQVGRDGRCRCVFCDGDRKDTLRFYPGERGFYCFRCHERGDVISLYQKLTGAGFRQAIEDLNEQYGLGLPLKDGDREAVEKARREAAERKRRREAEKEKQDALFAAYLDAADAVWIMEQNLTEAAPKTREEPWRQRFLVSLRYLDEMREQRDRLYDELYPMKGFF